MEETGISLTQDEIDRVMNGVRSDNAANEKKAEGEAGVSLSQAELDALFSGKKTIGTMAAAEPAHEQTAAEKIAARKKEAADLLKKVNSQSPKRVSAVYGTALLNGEKIDFLEAGSVLELERPDGSAVEILCDGKLIARGFAGKSHGHAAVKITEVFK